MSEQARVDRVSAIKDSFKLQLVDNPQEIKPNMNDDIRFLLSEIDWLQDELQSAQQREQKLIEGLQEVYALIENVEDYANVKYARDEIERLFKELGVTE